MPDDFVEEQTGTSLGFKEHAGGLISGTLVLLILALLVIYIRKYKSRVKKLVVSFMNHEARLAVSIGLELFDITGKETEGEKERPTRYRGRDAHRGL